MSYKRKNSDYVSAFKLINKQIREDNLPKVLLLCGKEQFLVDWTISTLKNKYINKSTELLDYCSIEGSNATLESIIEACETLSMFSTKRIVEIKNFPPLQGKILKGFGQNEEERLSKYIKNIPDGILLIFSDEKPDMRLKLCRTISSLNGVYKFDTLNEKDLENFIIKHFKTSKKFCKSIVIEEIVSKSGYFHYEAEYTLYNLENDLKKIVAHSNGEEIFLSDVLSTISGNLETSSFAMVDALSRGNKREAYRLLFNINPVQDEMRKLLALTISQFELILKVKELREEGNNQETIANYLGIHSFRIKKAIDFSTQCSKETFRVILKKAYEIDYNIKLGMLNDRLAFEMFIAEA